MEETLLAYGSLKCNSTVKHADRDICSPSSCCEFGGHDQPPALHLRGIQWYPSLDQTSAQDLAEIQCGVCTTGAALFEKGMWVKILTLGGYKNPELV
jgi:hypothetical protein